MASTINFFDFQAVHVLKHCRSTFWSCFAFMAFLVQKGSVIPTMIAVPSNKFKASCKTSLLRMSKWLVGSSMIRKLQGFINNFASATRFLSPPESTEFFLKTSFPLNNNAPKAALGFASGLSYKESSTSVRTSFSGSNSSA